MKKTSALLVMGSIIFTSSLTAMAQPTKRPAAQSAQKQASQSPEVSALENFLAYCISGKLQTAADYVEGANKNSPALSAIQAEMKGAFDHFKPNIRNATVTPDSKNSHIAKLSYKLVIADRIFNYGTITTENITMQSTETSNSITWKIIPYDLSKRDLPLFDTFDENGEIKPPQDFIRRMATLIAYPEKSLPGVYLQLSMERMKQLGVATFLLAQDHKEKFDFDQKDFREKLGLYAKDGAIFTAPGDKKGTSSYSLNPLVAGKTLKEIKTPSKTVLYYLGKNQKLSFPYNGLSTVCFADGHVEAVSEKAAKKLRWDP